MFKRKCFQFTRTASVIDLRTDALSQLLKARKRRAASFYYAHGMSGRASFGV